MRNTIAICVVLSFVVGLLLSAASSESIAGGHARTGCATPQVQVEPCPTCPPPVVVPQSNCAGPRYGAAIYELPSIPKRCSGAGLASRIAAKRKAAKIARALRLLDAQPATIATQSDTGAASDQGAALPQRVERLRLRDLASAFRAN